jgi:hypothetical protein
MHSNKINQSIQNFNILSNKTNQSIKNCDSCLDKTSNQNCDTCSDKANNLIQNCNMLMDEIPEKLKNLEYAIYPCNPLYNDVRFIYNKLWNYYPNAIFYPRNICEIKYILKNILKNKLLFTIRAGGHAYEAASLNDYIIDVSKLSKISINKKKKIVYMECGVKLGKLLDELKKCNLICSTGESRDVGCGVYLQGGKGYVSKLLMMSCDNILELEIMNYQGKILKANSKKNPDLFWALKGAGANNFGIVLSFKIKAYDDLYMRLTTLKWVWNSEKIKELLNDYFKWIALTPINISTDLIISYSNGEAYVSIMFFKFTKNCSKDFKEIDNFVNYENPTITKCSGYYSQTGDCWSSSENGYNNVFSKLKSIMIFNPVNNDFIKNLIHSIEELLTDNKKITFKYNFTELGGNVQYGDSCYFPKTALLALTMPASWSDPKLTSYAKLTIKTYYDKLIQDIPQYVFPNMIDYDLEDYMEAYYGTNANRLKVIKKIYDPDDIFTWPQSIR